MHFSTRNMHCRFVTTLMIQKTDHTLFLLTGYIDIPKSFLGSFIRWFFTSYTKPYLQSVLLCIHQTNREDKHNLQRLSLKILSSVFCLTLLAFRS